MAAQPPDTNLVDLATKIGELTATINSYLKENNLPGPSFKKDAPLRLPNAPEVQGARFELVEAALDLYHLAAGPADYLFWQSKLLHHDQHILHLLNHYDFWDAVPLKGSVIYSEIATKVHLSESLTRRILRYAFSMRLFAETADGKVEHTATSAVPVRRPKLKAWIGHNIDDVGAACFGTIPALERWGESEHPGQTGLAIQYFPENEDETKGLFQFLNEDDRHGKGKGWREKRFGEAMECLTEFMGISIDHVHQGYDWASLGNATIVDLGGSVGHVSFALAEKFPNLTFIVQDLPGLESQFTAARPSSLSSRVSFQAHDFFTPEPYKGADVYFMKHILHDWSDLYATKILKLLIPALKPGGRVIIMECAVPRFSEAPLIQSNIAAGLDFQMLTVLNAKERTLEEWKALFSGADGKFTLKSAVQPPGSAFTVMEFVYA